MPVQNTTLFAGEEFLSYVPPNHEFSRRVIVVSAILLFVIIFVVIPKYIATTITDNDKETTNNKEEKQQQQQQIKQNLNVMTTQDSFYEDRWDNNDENHDNDVDMKKLMQLFCLFPKTLYTILIFSLLLFSPNNHHVARRVFQAPILHLSECQEIVQIAQSVADRNYNEAKNQRSNITASTTNNQQLSAVDKDKLEELDKILKWPEGWKKDRHGSYPTTDLNLATDFDPEARQYIQKILDARMSPLLERIFGVSRDAIRADDVFLVRYDGMGQQQLEKHRDGTILSFNILLNNDFEGGGTKFFLPEEESEDIVARPKVGEGIVHNSIMEHEGLATTKGTRFILVGFLNVDRIDWITGVVTNVSLFPTYLCFHWLWHHFANRLPEVILKLNINDLARQMLIGISFVPTIISRRFNDIVDGLAPFGIVKLVEDENYDRYLERMDENSSCYNLHSNWFDGNRNDLVKADRK